jgi:hypothetical protein
MNIQSQPYIPGYPTVYVSPMTLHLICLKPVRFPVNHHAYHGQKLPPPTILVVQITAEFQLPHLSALRASLLDPSKAVKPAKFSIFAVLVEKRHIRHPAKVANCKWFAYQLHPRPRPPYVHFRRPNQRKYEGTRNPVNALSTVKFHPKCHRTGNGVAGIRPNSTIEL